MVKASERRLKAIKLDRAKAAEEFRKAQEELEEATEEHTKCAEAFCSSMPPPKEAYDG